MKGLVAIAALVVVMMGSVLVRQPSRVHAEDDGRRSH
jgi:hypothetical protein